MNNSVDRVLALESAQHFKPLVDFILESKRVLIKSGLLVMAVPITVGDSSLGKLGLLKIYLVIGTLPFRLFEKSSNL